MAARLFFVFERTHRGLLIHLRFKALVRVWVARACACIVTLREPTESPYSARSRRNWRLYASQGKKRAHAKAPLGRHSDLKPSPGDSYGVAWWSRGWGF